ncbi:hypothetical protein [Ornithinibacillus bavariensis]|uniref:hypothetical protein n=1 Tax=Ornithinibacillus bavariensis TaxID=545502 RepID=UPI000EF063FC|nr:hypothetical protein [Ornithinibacillus sp.]
MSAKGPIVVRIDGHKKKINSAKGDDGRKKVETLAHTEAAAAEESSDRIHTFAREYDKSLMISKSKMKKQSTFSMFKPILIAIISALAIGSIMGFVMLKIIVNFDNELNPTPANVLPAEGEDGKENKKADSVELSSFTLDALSAYVLQGGVYSESANAETELGKYTDLGYAPIIWQRENQFYLLVNMADSKVSLQEDALSLANNNIEVYVKEWQISESKLELTEEEYNWITVFQKDWNNALQNGSINKETWKKLIDDAPNKTEHLTSFTASLREVLKQEGKGTGTLLMEMANAYEDWLASGKIKLEE